MKGISGTTGSAQSFVPGPPPRVVRKLLALDDRSTLVAALVGATLVIIVGLPLAVALNIWLDEAFTLHTTGSGFAYAWQQSIGFETQPPAYFALEAAWRTLDPGSIAFARLPSVIFAAAAVAVIVLAAHRIAPRLPPLGVALAAALNPLVIWAAVELRLYAFVLLIGALLAWTFSEGFLRDEPSRRMRIWHVVVAAVGLYTQYYIGFVLVAEGLTLLGLRRRAIPAFAVAMAAVGAAFVPFVPAALVHVAASGAYVARLGPVTVFHQLLDAVFVFVLPHEIWWHGATKVLGFATSLALLAALIVAGRPALAGPQRDFMVTAAAMVVIFGLMFSVSGSPIDMVRHVIVIAPASMLAAYLLLGGLTRRITALQVAAALMFAVFAAGTLWGRYHPPLLKVGDWRRVAATVEEHRANAPVVVFPADVKLLLDTYAPGLDPIPIPKPMPFTLDYDREMTLDSQSAVAGVLDRIAQRSAQVWVVTTGACTAAHVDYDYHCRYLQSYLDEHYRLLERFTFRGALAERYTRLPRTGEREGAPHAN